MRQNDAVHETINNKLKLVDAGAWMKYIFFSEQAPWACPAASEICGVEGCNNEVDFYVDFKKEQVEFTTSVSVTLEKSIRVTQEFEARPSEY